MPGRAIIFHPQAVCDDMNWLAHTHTHTWPDLFICSAEQLVDLLELRWLVAARQKRPILQELPKDAAHTPHVNGHRVGGGSQKQLRRTVPQRHHLSQAAAGSVLAHTVVQEGSGAG